MNVFKKLLIGLVLVGLFLMASCGGDNKDGITTPESTCSGILYDGNCWYYGAPNESCTSVCAAHGGYHEATKDKAGSHGTNEFCATILSFFEIPSGAEFWTGTQPEGIGCHYFPGDPNPEGRVTSPDTTADAKSTTGDRRVCACMN